MQGIRASIVGEQELRFEAFSLPDVLKRQQVRVQMERTIVSAGTELANYTGLESDTRVKGSWCAYPWTPGYGGVGRVEAVGTGVKDLKVGERVFGFFPHASHVLVNTDREVCVPVPDGLHPTLAVLGRLCGVAITGYQRSRVTLGDSVVVFGLGMVGNLGGQFFLAAGQRVLGIDTSEQRRCLAERVGYQATLDPTGLSDKQMAEKLKVFGGGKPPKVIVDAVGDARIVERAVNLVANNGQVIMLGTPRASYHTDSTLMLRRAHFHGVEIIGALEWTIPLLKRQSPGVSTEANIDVIFQMLRSGALQVMPLNSHILPPSELNTAYQGLLHQKDAYLGVVLDWENNPAPAALAVGEE